MQSAIAIVNRAAEQALALVEIWALIAERSGFVGAWRLTAVCRASRTGVKWWLGSLPGFLICGGSHGSGAVNDVWQLDLATLRWEPMPALVTARYGLSCCTVRGALIILGEECFEGPTSTVEILLSGEGRAFNDLALLSCGTIEDAATVVVEESDSAAGQVLLIGGMAVVDGAGTEMSTVYLVDLATGICTPQPALLDSRVFFAAARIPDGRVVCAGGLGSASLTSVEVFGPSTSGTSNADWTWTRLPAMSTGRYNCCGCVMSDGRFAVLGGTTHEGDESESDLVHVTESCEVLTLGDHGAYWEPLPDMHYQREGFACVAVAECIIVVGGHSTAVTEVYDEKLKCWFILSNECNLPNEDRLASMGSALW